MPAQYGDDFVYGWPKKHCGCDQVIEQCMYCSGSYLECPSCPHCHGLAYIAAPCPHSHSFFDMPVPSSSTPDRPSSHDATVAPAPVMRLPYGRQRQLSESSSEGSDGSSVPRSVGDDNSSGHSSTTSSPSKSIPSTSTPSSPTPRRRPRYPASSGKSSQGGKSHEGGDGSCGNSGGGPTAR